MQVKLFKMYYAAKLQHARGLTPHLVGPPGSGKSTIVEDLASSLDVNLHVLNVSRINPLELEGVQVPSNMDSTPRLTQLLATFWNSLEEGDIVFLDEFLRGFPEVYNALLDIMTSLRVGSHQLPWVFFIAASNSVTTYDPALDDRLLHLPVPDARVRSVQSQMMQDFIDICGLHPSIATTSQLEELFNQEIGKTYEILDRFKARVTQPTSKPQHEGKSMRHLIGQVQLREIKSNYLSAVIKENNRLALSQSEPQFLILTTPFGSEASFEQYTLAIDKLGKVDPAKMTDVQLSNLALNRVILEMRENLVNNNREDLDLDELITDPYPF